MTCCWWCCHEAEKKFELPIRYNPGADAFSTKGVFCSWSCMKAFAIKEYPTHVTGRICENITFLRKRLCGVVEPIKVAPDKYKLAMFGGPMTIEEFREGLVVDTVDFEIKKSDFGTKEIPVVTTNKMELIQSTTTKNEPLRMKRAKPLKRDNNLMNALGISMNSSSK